MVSKAKAALRKRLFKERNSMTEEERLVKSNEIWKKLSTRPRFRSAKTVAFYVHKGSEVITEKMITASLAEGKEVLVPVTNHEITFYRFTSFEDLVEGKYGILEPKARELPSKPPDLIVIPGVAFGLCMHRVGYGKGYYDDYLGRSFSYRIGICFDFQVEDSLPTHKNDQRMDEIITEKRIIT